MWRCDRRQARQTRRLHLEQLYAGALASAGAQSVATEGASRSAAQLQMTYSVTGESTCAPRASAFVCIP